MSEQQCVNESSTFYAKYNFMILVAYNRIISHLEDSFFGLISDFLRIRAAIWTHGRCHDALERRKKCFAVNYLKNNFCKKKHAVF